MPTTIQPGDTSKPDPFTVCIISNPYVEAPWQSGQFLPDPISGQAGAFLAAVSYIRQALFGQLPGQAEQMLGDPTIGGSVRLVLINDPGLPQLDQNALVGLYAYSNIVVARRDQIGQFVSSRGVEADVVYAVSANATHTRASAWPAGDDIARGGVAFTLDGVPGLHAYHSLLPGTIAIHASAKSLTALHEFHHAIGSYENGQVTDLYVDSSPAVNCKVGQPPVPPVFGTYNAQTFSSDPVRDSIGYEPGWRSFHCALHDVARPAIMDDYWKAADPNRCQDDQITRSFVLDRIRVKLSR